MAARQGVPPPPPPAPQVPPRDATPQAAPIGTGRISGLVVSDDSIRKPLRKATVTITASEIRGSRTETADDAGRFVFTALPMGRYSMSAQKSGYVRSQYGAKRVGQTSGETVSLAEGQRLDDITITLPRAAVMTGVVSDANARPLVGVRLTMLQYRFTNGQRVLGPATSAEGMTASTTDDRGMYRLYGLSPGDYVIVAQPANGAMNDVYPMTRADIQWAQQQVQRASMGTTATAGFVAPGAAQAQTPAPAPAQTVGYAPVYYPGTPDPRGASTVTLSAGEERAGLDFALPLVATARIEGTIVDPTGRGQREMPISLSAEGQPQGIGSASIVRTTGDGKFTAIGVPPGHYLLTTRTIPAPPPPPPPPPGAAAMAMPVPAVLAGGSNETMWAMTEIDVDGHDVTGVVLNLQPGMTAAGRIAFEATTMSVPQDMSPVRLTLSPVSPSPGLPASSSTAAVQQDGSFLFKGLTPGTYRLSAALGAAGRGGGPSASWTLKSAVVNGRNATDLPIVIKPNDQLTIAVTFSDRPAEISGKLLDASGRPATSYSIVIFSADQAYWGLQSRRTAQLRPQDDGQFLVSNLPAGDYYLSAVTHVESNDMADPGFFEQLVPASLRITLAEGEKKVQDLKLAGG